MRLLVAGGGVAALEAVLALRELAPDAVEPVLLAPNAVLELAPETIAEAVGGPPAARYDMAAIADDLELELIPLALADVQASAHTVRTRKGRRLPYDGLLLALGARPGPVLPGALRFAGRPDVDALRAALEDAGRVVFAATAGAGWTLPLYELALLVAARPEPRALTVVTPEHEPLELFGRAASAEVAKRLAAARVHVRTGAIAESVEGGRLYLATGGSIETDLAVALPEPSGPAVPGLPADARGFLPVDRFGRVTGAPDVWAAGDATARPLKQGGLAAQQAEVAARSIAAAAGADVEPQPYDPVLRGLLLTGESPRFLRRAPASAVPSAVSERPLWSPPGKVAGRRIGAYLAARPDLRTT
jgi:sulfide:quinone oxidoreductase